MNEPSSSSPLAPVDPLTGAEDSVRTSGSKFSDQDFSDLGLSGSAFEAVASAVDIGEVATLEELPTQLGDYALKDLIGAGGMGQVYLAQHVRMKRTVALKMLPQKMMSDPRAVQRFYEEIQAASSVLHPNIVAAFDAGEDKGIHYLAMEYVDGTTLTQLIATRGPCTIGESASIVRQAAMGLLHAHRAGIIHRDVKPGNIMRSVDGTVKVLDLGLARVGSSGFAIKKSSKAEDSGIGSSDSKPNKGRLIGTLSFMSPEQLEDPDSADARSDIYSLGATLFFLLTGQSPYPGEYLDQVYGHRHGEIPDLMQIRQDVDLQFANLFRRMLAKTPEARYASLDEVIGDLADYADKTNEPQWLAEFAIRQPLTEGSTIIGGSTSGSVSNVLAIDLGMFYATAAEASPMGSVNSLFAGGGNRALFRLSLASEERQILYGDEAMSKRATKSKTLLHCIPMYIGKPFVERELVGRRCPPEVLLSLLIRKLVSNCWKFDGAPSAVAITVPSSYDQLHRQSILQAAHMAGLKSVRLVDRSVAAAQSLLLSDHSSLEESGESEESVRIDAAGDSKLLFLGLTGQASEAAVFRCEAGRMKQISTAGHWHTGTLPWIQRLVDLASERFISRYRVDPRKSTHAAALQMACENAMNTMLLMTSATITIEVQGEKKAITLSRADWLSRCEHLIDGLRRAIKLACGNASLSRTRIDRLVTLGPLLRLKEVRDEVLRGLSDGVAVQTIDRTDIARGAAACLASELPGRGAIAASPQTVTSQTLGILVEDGQGRRRIMPIIPRGTILPARTNRRLTVSDSHQTMALSLVETSGVERDDWHSLGRYDFAIDEEQHGVESRARMIGFEINTNGLLTVRAQTPGMPGSTKLATLPKPTLSEEEVAAWARWIDKFD